MLSSANAASIAFAYAAASLRQSSRTGERTASSPAAASVAVASTSGLRALLRIATRSPDISGCVANTRTVSSRAVTVGTSITPVCSYSAALADADQRGPGAHRHDRFRRRHAPGDPSQLARVAERLGVQGDHVGRLVVLPELEQVVGREVALVAERHEPRQTEMERVGETQQRLPSVPDCIEIATLPGGTRHRHERGLQHGLGPRRGDPEARRADDPQAVAPGVGDDGIACRCRRRARQ